MKSYFILFIILTLYNCSPKVVHHTETIDYNQQSTLQKKFSNLINVPSDSICNLRFYRNLENWNSTKDSLDFKSITYPILFINFICYKQYNITLPFSYNEIKKSKNVFLYRDTNYLKEGDLIFFEEKNSNTKSIGIYLKNKHFASASLNGDLKYYQIKDTLSQIKILSNAKLYIQ